MPVLWILTSTSFGPMAGTGASIIQMPGSAFDLASAFISTVPICPSDDAHGPAGVGEGRRHLRADARLAFGDDGVEEPGNEDAALVELGSHLLGPRRIVEHDG